MTAVAQPWNKDLAPGQSLLIGFQGTHTGANPPSGGLPVQRDRVCSVVREGPAGDTPPLNDQGPSDGGTGGPDRGERRPVIPPEGAPRPAGPEAGPKVRARARRLVTLTGVRLT